MARLENEMAADSGRGRLRASDADREHTVDTLKAAYVHGLVTKDEFDAKISRVFAASTYAELALITAGIPAGLAAAPPPLRPRPAKADPPAHADLTPGERAIIGTGLLAGLAVLVAFLVGGPVGGLLGLGATASAFVSLFLVGAQVRSSRHNRHSGRHLPPRVTHSSPGAGRLAASVPPAEQLPNPSKPRRRSNADAARRHSLNPQL